MIGVRFFRDLWYKIINKGTDVVGLVTNDAFLEYPRRFDEEERMFLATRHIRNIVYERITEFKKRGDLFDITTTCEIEMASNFLCAITSDRTVLFMHSTPYVIREGTDCDLLVRLVRRYLKYDTEMRSIKAQQVCP